MKKILDIFSYVPSNVLSLEEIEQAFVCSDDNSGSPIEFSFEKQVPRDDMQGAINELLSENKEVAIVKMNGELIAVVGFVNQR